MKEVNFMFKSILRCFCIELGRNVANEAFNALIGDPMFQNLLNNPHGENRWRDINRLHAIYGISRDVIMALIKKFRMN